MKIAGRVSADTLTYLAQFIQPGITTKELDQKAEQFIKSQKCIPAFLNYKDFPGTVCISVNEEVVHCIPSDRKLQNGDIVTLDLGAIYEGFYGDTAQTFIVGNVSPEIQKFVSIGYLALVEGIKQIRPGNFIGDISNVIANVITSNGYGIVREFVGHGIGTTLHEHPQIPNFKLQNKGPELVEGMVICLEPILTMGNGKVRANGPWNTYSEDKTLACHFEHTVVVTEDGFEILTKRSDEPEIIHDITRDSHVFQQDLLRDV